MPSTTVSLPHYAPGDPLPPDISSLSDKGVSFRSLAPATRRVPPPPRFMLGTVSAPVLARHFALSQMGPVGIFHARGLDLYGDYLVARDGVPYRMPLLNLHDHSILRELDFLRAHGTTRQRRPLPGRHVLLLGNGAMVYGHWLIDMLPKFGLLKAAGHDITTLRYLVPTTAQYFVHDFLDLLGIAPAQRIAYDPTVECVAAEELLIPTMVNNGVRMSHLLRDAVAVLAGMLAARNGPLMQADTPRKLFLSRSTMGPARGLANRARIEQMSQRAGFTVLAPERLKLLDQVRMFASATHIMGEYGSALHGSMFSPPGTCVCALRGDAVHPHFIQSGIGAVLGQPTGYIFGGLVPGTINLPLVYDFDIPDAVFSAGLDAFLAIEPPRRPSA